MGWREGLMGSPRTPKRDRAAASPGSQFVTRALHTVLGSRDPHTAQLVWRGGVGPHFVEGKQAQGCHSCPLGWDVQALEA